MRLTREEASTPTGLTKMIRHLMEVSKTERHFLNLGGNSRLFPEVLGQLVHDIVLNGQTVSTTTPAVHVLNEDPRRIAENPPQGQIFGVTTWKQYKNREPVVLIAIDPTAPAFRARIALVHELVHGACRISRGLNVPGKREAEHHVHHLATLIDTVIVEKLLGDKHGLPS